MQTTNTFSDTFEERMNILDATNRYKLDIQYTQQVFQPIRETYEPSQQIRVILQRSNHVIRVSDIGIMFRPVIKYAKDSLPDVSRKSFLCITPTCASDFFQMVVLTTNGNSLLSQSGCPASSNRAQMMNFYNSLRPIQGNKLGAEDSLDAGVTFPSSSLNTLVGCEENSINHPYQPATNGLILPQYASNYSYADGDQFARAIISRAYVYNLDHNIPPSNRTNQPGSAYFAGYWGPQMLPLQNANSGFTPIANGGAGGNQDPAGVTYNVNLPCLPLCITPSISQYHLCNSRFQALRMRFITSTTSFFSFAGSLSLSPSTMQAWQTSLTNNMNNNGNLTPANYGDAPQRMSYGSSIQGVYDQGSTLLYGGGNSVARQLGVLPTSANCTYYPTENYTNLVCRLGAVSMELEEIGDIEFSQTQLVAILQLNPPEQVLSAYLQTGCMFIDKSIASLGTKNYTDDAVNPIGGCRPGPTSAECYQFLQSCLIGSASYQLTELCARIPYKTFPLQTQGIVREICYASRPFRSFRVQSDIINNPNAIQTQRISIGGSSICLGVITFIKPVFPSLTSDQVIRPQDTMVCYQGCNVPSLGDLRYVPQLDSCYLPSVQFSLQVDNNIYDANPIIPISSPQYSTYLKSLDGIPLIFDGKQTPINLRDFVTNRYFMAIGINSRALQEAAIVDQQIIVSASFDASERINIAKAMGTVRQNCNACFMMTSYVITMQSLVNDDYVKI